MRARLHLGDRPSIVVHEHKPNFTAFMDSGFDVRAIADGVPRDARHA